MPLTVSTAAWATDLYPFVLSPRAIEKLGFVHALISRKRRSKRDRSALLGNCGSETGNCYRWLHSRKRCTFADAYDKSRIYLLPPELIRCGMGDAPVTWDGPFLESSRGSVRTEKQSRGEEMSSKQTYHSGGTP
ncbi:MAG: hypothetical protein ACREV3_01575 [Gammaproteobacteria bacterium]